MNPDDHVFVYGKTPVERLEESADYIKRLIMRMSPGDSLVVTRHAERQPGDSLLTVRQVTHE